MRDPGEKTVLIVDDDEPTAQLLRELFRYELGCHVITAGDAETASLLLRDIRVHLIILDMLLPTISGLDFYDCLRSNPSTKDIPVLFMTASTTRSGSQMELEGRGITNYVTKPFDVDGFIEKVRSLLSSEPTQ